MQVHQLYESLMRECLTLARRGAGAVSPNPMVGAVLFQNGKIIGKGYHKKFGFAHAEIEAIRNSRSSLKGATLVVNLEPCTHFGKTPPCVDEIIAQGISTVIIGNKDPNPFVAGKGMAKLKRAGINVTVGVLPDECQKLNETFFKHIVQKIPFVTLKAAQTLDGKIADTKNVSQWISGEESRTYVHQLRGEYDAVLVGAGTVLADNPLLTVRNVQGRNPHRIILDGNFRTELKHKIYKLNSEARVFLFISSNEFRSQKNKVQTFLRHGIEVIPLKSGVHGKIDIGAVLVFLGKQNITSVLVEGGASIFSQFIEQRLADKVLVFVAPLILGQGKETISFSKTLSLKKAIPLHNVSMNSFGKDFLIEGYLK